ncbi:sensor domain-containing protein [[Mycobacterium] nativiensis]|uniref:Sensor domain-containing protein n=1 Tax=[Mycobacterium] nativiensis TaxID=2855503 RepID=A0ABU5Y2K8_9MYCO|nr:sensor domain-containing protein [Mycolicibacter sp. MYC340]MEB3033966.1 sensor domain-containing protein [Mycolicibacter sp. MYC340]
MRIQIAAVVAGSVVALIGVALNGPGGFTGASAHAAPKQADLAAALVSADEISERLDTPMQVISSESATRPMTTPTVTPANCTVVYSPGSAAGYDGSGYTDIVVQTLRSSDGEVTPNVVQAVAEFPDAKSAQTYLNDQAATWKNCKGTAFTAEYTNGMTYDLKVSNPTVGGLELFTNLFTNPMKGTAGCERLLQAKNNYIVDVRLCTDTNSGGKGRSLRSQIVRNLA